MDLKIYSTCPQSKDIPSAGYLAAVADVAAWSEEAGCTGILIYTDNGIVDPWLVSQAVIERTRRLRPLVAVQPVYMHPYTAAKQVVSIAYLHGRGVDLNILAGGFTNDLRALGDETAHDDRYARTIEYTQIMMKLLRGDSPVTASGGYYHVSNLRLTPRLPADLIPKVLISGSSPAGLAAARALGATAVRYPEPPGAESWEANPSGPFGVRVGIIARADPDEAWCVALERFPEDRRGQIAHRLAMQVSDSHWHRRLSGREDERPVADNVRDPYWLGPFNNYKTFCPYLVGSYDQVRQFVVHYISLGARTFILDIPPSRDELQHIGVVFDAARNQMRPV